MSRKVVFRSDSCTTERLVRSRDLNDENFDRLAACRTFSEEQKWL